MNEKSIKEFLINGIRCGDESYTVSYKSLAAHFGFSWDRATKAALEVMLGSLSTMEFNEGRPLISSVVVSERYGVAGKGFNRLAVELGKQSNRGKDEDISFSLTESQKTRDYWKGHS